jgi:hypothetical protein
LRGSTIWGGQQGVEACRFDRLDFVHDEAQPRQVAPQLGQTVELVDSARHWVASTLVGCTAGLNRTPVLGSNSNSTPASSIARRTAATVKLWG